MENGGTKGCKEKGREVRKGGKEGERERGREGERERGREGERVLSQVPAELAIYSRRLATCVTSRWSRFRFRICTAKCQICIMFNRMLYLVDAWRVFSRQSNFCYAA